jgi:hypothetical protein
MDIVELAVDKLEQVAVAVGRAQCLVCSLDTELGRRLLARWLERQCWHEQVCSVRQLRGVCGGRLLLELRMR